MSNSGYWDKNGNYQGVDAEYDEEGRIVELTTYKDGLLHGLRFSYRGFDQEEKRFRGYYHKSEEIGFWFCIEMCI